MGTHFAMGLQQKIVRSGGVGRSSISGLKVTVFGATGATGRYVINQLGRNGTRCMIPCRDPDYYFRHLKMMGDLGVITPQYFDVRNKADVAKAVAGSNVVLNMIGKSSETSNFNYQQVHVDAARTIAEAAKDEGIEQFYHVSALGASSDSKCDFYKSKAAGEEAVTSVFSDACIIRPAMLLGQEARFFQDLGDRARAEPIMRIAPGAKKTLMQPAYVDDVGVAIANAVHMDWEDVKGRTYELGGPTTFTYEELVEMTVSMVQRDTPLVEFSERFEFINKAISGFVGGLADRFRLDSLDRQRLTQENCLVSGEHPGFEDLNVTPQELKDMLFTSLHRHRTDNSFMTAN